MTKRRLTEAQLKNLLEWIAAWCALLIPILTIGMLAYLSSLQSAWWSRAIFVALLVVELGLYYLWGMISVGRIAPRTLLVSACKPLRDLAYFLLHLTRSYASEGEVTFTVIELWATPAQPKTPEAKDGEVQ